MVEDDLLGKIEKQPETPRLIVQRGITELTERPLFIVVTNNDFQVIVRTPEDYFQVGPLLDVRQNVLKQHGQGALEELMVKRDH